MNVEYDLWDACPSANINQVAYVRRPKPQLDGKLRRQGIKAAGLDSGDTGEFTDKLPRRVRWVRDSRLA